MNSNTIYIKKITDSLIELEKNHNLLEWKIENIFAWQASRIKIYTLLLDIFKPNYEFTNKESLLKNLTLKICRVIKNSIFKNPFLDFKKSEVLVFESDRKYLVDNNYIDIYTKYFCEDLKNRNIIYKKYGTSSIDYDLKIPNKGTKQLDFIYTLSKIISNFVNVSFIKSDIKKIKEVEHSIEFLLGLRINLIQILRKEIVRFKSEYQLYRLLFRIKKAQSIYLINSSNKAALIKAAKDIGIIVNELQHGLIAKEGLIAHYPHVKADSLAYFPNKFFVWKNLNMISCKLPLSDKNIVKFKNKHLQYMLKKNSKFIRNKYQILVASQPYNSDEIFNFIINNLEEMRNWRFIYKIHPTENIDNFLKNPKYNSSIHKNLTFVANEVSIYNLFAESEYIIGVYTTALFEAAYFGCKIILLNLPGVELVNHLVKENKAMLLDPSENLKKIIDSNYFEHNSYAM